ncbi:MAG TPA: helix-turn-helix domain-containing protein, partial [Bacteroidia bacterium]|nr:helix-turn-helix domain-containing protein [Bacteroidia bacterium]
MKNNIQPSVRRTIPELEILNKQSLENRRSTFTKVIHDAVTQKLANTELTRYVDVADWIKANYLPGVNQNTLKNYIRRQFGKQLKQMKLLNCEVKESFEALASLYNVSQPFIKPRIKMLIVLKREGSITISDLARKTGIVYNSAVKWQNFYRSGGLTSLLDVKKGKNNWNVNSGYVFTKEVIKSIEQEHAIRPFKSYTALYKWVVENHL